jgi:hypothetical protein
MKQLLFYGTLLFVSMQTPDLLALNFKLPDQSTVQLESQPGLEARKVSRLNLRWPSESAWTPIAFDAEMPDHKHGMNVKASAPQKVPGTPLVYQVEGVKLHMPGLWVLRLQVKNQAGEVKWVDTPYQLPKK